MGDTVRQMFTAIAQHYDVLNTVLSFGLHHYWRQQAVIVSGIPSGARLLDVCSGTADLAIAFARYLGHNGQVIAMDFCAAMLGRGHQKAVQQGIHLMSTLADAQCLPFGDAVFDAVTVAFGLRNVDNLATALREMYRVLRPGGTALVLEFGQPHGVVLGPLYRFYSHAILPRLGGWVSGHPEAYTYLPRTAAVFPAGTRFVHEMVAQNFTAVHAQALSGGIVYVYRAMRPI
jgi:demethylmenaquinone methyltransferase/2-methoxy-6-polyprenyl-1,4-benzoquinol methylase